MASQMSNMCKFALMKKEIDLSADSLKVILMDPGFIYSPITHGQYSDVSAYELDTANGYTSGGSSVTGQTVSQNDTLGCGQLIVTHAGWTATGGSIGPASGAIIYDDTTSAGGRTDVVVAYVDFGGNKTATTGVLFKLSDITIRIT